MPESRFPRMLTLSAARSIVKDAVSLLLTAVCQPVIFLVGAKKGVFMTIPDLDQAKAEQFAERMVGVLNEGAIALMTSIGHRTGLFAGCALP